MSPLPLSWNHCYVEYGWNHETCACHKSCTCCSVRKEAFLTQLYSRSRYMNLGDKHRFWWVDDLAFTCCLIFSCTSDSFHPSFSVCAYAALLSLNTDFLHVYAGDTCIFIKPVAFEWSMPNSQSKYKLPAPSLPELNVGAKSQLSLFLGKD